MNKPTYTNTYQNKAWTVRMDAWDLHYPDCQGDGLVTVLQPSAILYNYCVWITPVICCTICWLQCRYRHTNDPVQTWHWWCGSDLQLVCSNIIIITLEIRAGCDTWTLHLTWLQGAAVYVDISHLPNIRFDGTFFTKIHSHWIKRTALFLFYKR